MKVKSVVIDISADASNSTSFQTDGLLLCGIKFPAAMTGSNITFDHSLDNSAWSDVKETDGSDTSYTVSAGDLIRLDPSGWAFASNGYLRITSDGTEAADRTIEVYLRRS
jgi:hypothetical protein|tara:strand:+ start:93 stop:422 length:330 start_codon:yes stop_codon:yes gene_type:complete